MSYEIKPANVFGRLGKGIGQGLSEQLPKEIERGRLASGLKNLEQQKDLDPMQFFTQALSIPGITPQAIESLGKLAKQRMQGEALKGFKTEGREAFPKSVLGEGKERGREAPSITTRNPIEATLNPYIPKSFTEINQRAADLYEENPAFYQNDPQLAQKAAIQEDTQEQAINAALQGQRTNEQNVQNTVVSSLRNQEKALGVEVPSDVYDQIENRAVNAVRSKKDGGEGITEYEAMKKYGGELDAISRDYSAIDGLGNWGIITKKPSETLGAIKSLQSKFAERNDLENFAQRIMSKNKLSPGIAYNLAFPVSANKPLNNALQSAPKVELPPGHIGKQGEPVFKEHIIKKTQTLAEKLGPLLGKNGSPLSVGQELKAKGYDPQTWMNYLRKNRKSLDLTESQARQLDKAIPSTPSLNDLWLLNFTGLDKLEALE